MRTKVKTIVVASLIAASPAVFAAGQGNANKPNSADNKGQMMQGQGKMDHQGMMNNGKMPMKQMMSQMNEMMATCNKMMQRRMEKTDSTASNTDKG
ncbi:hypothetical protein [Salinisphaera orenii]|uniref:hypothetical protein n=1 Tax=Salinisphaera orenii TaxID=856731 RepID=UPI000DBE7FFB